MTRAPRNCRGVRKHEGKTRASAKIRARAISRRKMRIALLRKIQTEQLVSETCKLRTFLADHIRLFVPIGHNSLVFFPRLSRASDLRSSEEEWWAHNGRIAVWATHRSQDRNLSEISFCFFLLGARAAAAAERRLSGASRRAFARARAGGSVPGDARSRGGETRVFSDATLLFSRQSSFAKKHATVSSLVARAPRRSPLPPRHRTLE